MHVLLHAHGFRMGRDRVRSLRDTSHGHHDDGASNNRKCGPLKRAEVLGIRYCYLLVHVNGSDLFAVRTAGVNLSTRIRIVWHQGKVGINRLLGKTPTAHGTVCHLPYEVVEMIIAHIAHDLNALKASSLTCSSWYFASSPHLHHTFTLRDWMPSVTRGELKPLLQLYQLSLTPLIKEIRVEQHRDRWFAPQAFSSLDLGYFSAFANLQTLRFQYLDISLFMPDIERYFGHFSPTLRSIAFSKPCCAPSQLSYFLSLFPNLDDIKVWGISTYLPYNAIPDPELVPLSTPRLQGRLVVHDFDSVEIWTRLIAAGGGLRFHYMELWKFGGCAPALFEACAETLETLRFYAADVSAGEWFNMSLSMYSG